MSDVTLDPLDDAFDKQATPVGKKKCCSYTEHVKRHAARVQAGVGGTWTEFKTFITSDDPALCGASALTPFLQSRAWLRSGAGLRVANRSDRLPPCLRCVWSVFSVLIDPKGNIFQMAIGFILALQFNEVVKSLTNDIIMPPVGMAIGNNLVSLFVVIKLGKSYYNQSNKVNGVAQLAEPPPPPYLSIVQAQADGAVTWNYGNFFQTCINFIIVALILFLLVIIWAKLTALKMYILKQKAAFVPTLVDCTHCYSQVDERSSICKFCHHPREPKKTE